jgi:HEAT repeat protein
VKSVASRLSDTDPQVCVIAAKTIGEFAFQGTTSMNKSEISAGKLANKELEKLYKKGGDAQTIASIGLVELENTRAIMGISNGLSHSNPLFRRTCASVIPSLVKKGIFSASKARKTLFPLLNDPSKEVRFTTVMALLQFTSPEKIPDLKKLGL